MASDRVCIKKVPYQYISVPPGTIVEPLDPANLTCKDQDTIVDGKAVFACYGTEGITTELRLTNPACSASNLLTGTGQCQDGYGFDAAQQCCSPLPAAGAGSVIIKVNMGICP